MPGGIDSAPALAYRARIARRPASPLIIMKPVMRFLIVDDSLADARLVTRALEQQGFSAECRRVDRHSEFQAAMDEAGWDAILLDYMVPGMDCRDILKLLAERLPDTPLILVSGAIGEEEAADLLRQGAWDLVLKHHLTRLGPSLRHGLREAAERRAWRAAERSLQANEELTRCVMDSLPNSIAVLDEKGTILRVNRKWREFGEQNGASGDFVGQNNFDMCAADPDMGSRALAGMRAVLAGELPEFNLDYPCHAPHEQRWFRLQATPLEGSRRGLVISHTDITERNLADDAARESNSRHRMLFENLLDGYAHCRMIFEDGVPVDFIYLTVNPAFHRLTGLQDVEGKRFSEIFPGAILHHGDDIARFGQVVLTGKPTQFETYFSQLECWLLFSVFRPAEGEFSAVFENTTEARRREKELQARRADLEFLQQRQIAAQTAAAIAHELNQPLGAISAYSEVALRMLQGGDPEKLARALEGSAEQAQRAGRTLHELLDFMQHGEIQVAPTDLNEVVRESIALAQSDGHLGFQPVLKLQTRLPSVLANRTQLQKVIVNLVRNGVEAMHEAGVPDAAITITVRTLTESRLAQVSVQDTGPGVDADAARRIFDPFFSTKPRGIGLGLAISRALIEAHGGQLWVEPGTSRGATFHFTLPLAEEA